MLKHAEIVILTKSSLKAKLEGFHSSTVQGEYDVHTVNVPELSTEQTIELLKKVSAYPAEDAKVFTPDEYHKAYPPKDEDDK